MSDVGNAAMAKSNYYTAVVSIRWHYATPNSTTRGENTSTHVTVMQRKRDGSISTILFGFCLDFISVHFATKILDFCLPRGVEPLFAPCVDYLLVKIIYLLLTTYYSVMEPSPLQTRPRIAGPPCWRMLQSRGPALHCPGRYFTQLDIFRYFDVKLDISVDTWASTRAWLELQTSLTKYYVKF